MSLTPEQVANRRANPDSFEGYEHVLCDSHEELRKRAEDAEAKLRKASGVFAECADDCMGTPTEQYFRDLANEMRVAE